MGLLRFGLMRESPNPHLHRRGWQESRVTSYTPQRIAGGGAYHPLRHPPAAASSSIIAGATSRLLSPICLHNLFCFVLFGLWGRMYSDLSSILLPCSLFVLAQQKMKKDLIFLRGGEVILFEIRTSIFKFQNPDVNPYFGRKWHHNLMARCGFRSG